MNNRYKRFIITIMTIAPMALSSFSQTDSFSWGALDVVASGDRVAGTGPLDVVTVSAKGNASAVDVAAVLSSVQRAKATTASSGALDYISRAYSGTDYYSSGAWNSTNPAALWGGQMMHAPSWGRVTSMFGFRPRFGRMHKGIDIAMCVGDTVCVPLPGVVDRINYEAGGYGNYVVVKHDNGLETRYAHLQSVLVTPGDRVGELQPIALSGNTGNSTGPHLHFETRVNGQALDPMTLFDFSGGGMRPIARISGAMVGQSADGMGALTQVTNMGSRDKALLEKRTYVVKAGDTLSKIAGRAGVSVYDLCRLNFISETDPLKPGTMLRLRR